MKPIPGLVRTVIFTAILTGFAVTTFANYSNHRQTYEYIADLTKIKKNNTRIHSALFDWSNTKYYRYQIHLSNQWDIKKSTNL